MINIFSTVSLSFILIFLTFVCQAQCAESEHLIRKIYCETPSKINDLVHTKLDVRFDCKKRYLYGKEWVTLKPHFYPVDSLRLDAKGMNINHISITKW